MNRLTTFMTFALTFVFSWSILARTPVLSPVPTHRRRLDSIHELPLTYNFAILFDNIIILP